MSLTDDMLDQKNALVLGCAESVFNALQDSTEMRFGHAVEHLATISFTGQESAALHESQMLRCHGTWEITSLSQLPDRILPLQKHLDNPQSMRMSQRAEALCGLPQGIHVSQT